MNLRDLLVAAADELPDVQAAAVRAAGLVQAFESEGEGYVVGVQWHPEENAADKRLFAGLVAAASAFRIASHRGVKS